MIKTIKNTLYTAALCCSFMTPMAYAVASPAVEAEVDAEQIRFNEYVASLKKEALERGFNADLVDKAFTGAKLRKKVIKADKTQPEFIETLETYIPKRVPDWKVKKARKLYKDNKELLEKIGKEYGVQPRFIVALWGLESNFGKIQGRFPVVSSLITLSFDGRREAFFKKELWAAMDIVQNQGVEFENFKGSWAGAMGQTQFMPSSYKAYAVDYDGDGVKDIWQTPADVFASAANYLKTRGWNDNLTWGRQVKLPEAFDFTNVVPKSTNGRKDWLNKWGKTERNLSDWDKLGVTRTDGSPLPKVNVTAAMMIPDGKKGRAYLAYDNYKVLMHWNRSYYFVSTVGYLADRIGYPAIK